MLVIVTTKDTAYYNSSQVKHKPFLSNIQNATICQQPTGLADGLYNSNQVNSQLQPE